MSWLERLFHKSRSANQIDKELRFHLEQQVKEYIAAGMSAQEATRRARLEFGGLDRVKEEIRDTRKVNFIQDAAQDVRFGIRLLVKNSGFTAVAVLTLALGIGANTAIFALINTVMLNRLPVGHPQELVLLHWVAHAPGPYVWNAENSYGGCDMRDPYSEDSSCSFSYSVFQDFCEHASSFQGIAGLAGGFEAQLDMNGQSTIASGRYVSANFFSVLEVRPAFGRLLMPADDLPGAPSVVVLDFAYWHKQFNGNPNVIGTSISLDGAPFTIVGVAPSEFFGISPGSRKDLWIPLHAQDAFWKLPPDYYQSQTIWLYLVGRLKPGVTAERARLETEILFRANLASTLVGIKPAPIDPLRPAQPINADLGIAITSAARGLANLREHYSTQLFLLLGVTGLVVLIACANIANLLLSRASARRREIAVRLAIGAGRGRLLRQLFTESLLLAALGAAAGLAISFWLSRGIILIAFRENSAQFLAQFRQSPLVFAFTSGVAAICAILFGTIPALTGLRVALGSMLKSASSTSCGSNVEGRTRIGRSLVTAEFAIALVLIVGAGLALRTLIYLETLDPGIKAAHILTFAVSPSSAKISSEKVPALVMELLRRMSALPGAERVTWSDYVPLTGGLSRTETKVQEHQELGYIPTQLLSIGPQFFETMQIPILSGRSISVADCRKDGLYVWVSQAFVGQFLKNLNPLGLHLELQHGAYEIVGVVGNTKFQSLRDPFLPGIFTPKVGGYFNFELRTADNPTGLERGVRDVFVKYAPNLPIRDMRSMQTAVDDNLSAQNALARLFSGFGLLALGLAAVGVYGVLSYSVVRRTSEIAIRMSLGAMPHDILRLILKEGLVPAAIGSIIGILGSWALTRFVAQFLYGVRPLDAITYSVSTIVLLAVAILACVIPARRAMRVAPMTALRYE